MKIPSSLSLLAVLLLGAAPAFAGTTVHHVGIQTTNTDWGTSFNPVQVPGHDPALGTLTSVTLCFRGAVARRVRVESLDMEASTVQVSNLSSAFLLRRPSNQSEVIEVRRFVYPDVTFQLAAYDGTTDYGGASGGDTLGMPRAMDAVDPVLTAQPDLNYFTGMGPKVIPIDLHFNTTITGPGNLMADVRAEAMVTGMVIYEWTPPGP